MDISQASLTQKRNFLAPDEDRTRNFLMVGETFESLSYPDSDDRGPGSPYALPMRWPQHDNDVYEQLKCCTQICM